MQTKIGNALLNTDGFAGDAKISKADLANLIIKNSNRTEFDSFLMLNAFSPMRINTLQWYNFEKNSKILELGADLGVVTEYLSSFANVTAVTDCPLKAEFICHRCETKNTLKVYATDCLENYLMSDINKYDYIIFQGGILSETELKRVKFLLNDNGTLLIATENRNGLRYYSGSPDEYTGGFFDGVENYRGGERKTLDKKGWETLLGDVGFENIVFRYPYPDHKFAEVIYSDSHLPHKNELINNLRNFDYDRLVTFDEGYVFNGILEQGLFQYFSNSFFIEAGKNTSNVSYVKFSKERREEYNIYTKITDISKTQKQVCKFPTSAMSEAHVNRMLDYYDTLKEYFNGKFKICDCKKSDSGLEFEYVKGNTLNRVLNKNIYENNFEELKANILILKEAVTLISDYNREFIPDDKFKTFFGIDEMPNGFHPTKLSVVDMTADNLIINDKINIVDYEWIFDFSIPAEFILWRSLIHNGGISTLPQDKKNEIYNMLGVDISFNDLFLKMEIKFQNSISQKDNELNGLLSKFGRVNYNLRSLDVRWLTYGAVVTDAKSGKVLLKQLHKNGHNEIELRDNCQEISIMLECGSLIVKNIKLFGYQGDAVTEISNYEDNANYFDGENFYFIEHPVFTVKKSNFDKLVFSYDTVLFDNPMIIQSACKSQSIEKEKNACAELNVIYSELKDRYNELNEKYVELDRHVINRKRIKYLLNKMRTVFKRKK